MADLVVTTSWDDGHPSDLRLAETLNRHGIAGTFYVPIANSEGWPVMPEADLRALAAGGFEIAAHTLDHVRLTGLDPVEAHRQVVEGKARLEEQLGRPVAGFAYSGGRVGHRERTLVAEAGFRHARTTRMLCLRPGPDPLQMATTLQFYPHAAGGVMRNWARRGGGLARLRVGLAWLRAGSLECAVETILDDAAARGGVFHLWGHSWEIEREGLWPALDRVLALLGQRAAQHRTNAEVAGIR